MSMKNDLKIKHCDSAGCGYPCEDFPLATDSIKMLPGELEQAKGTGHLVVMEDYLGGKKVRCNARNRATCDDGYKPIHCAVFPLWARSDTVVEKSTRCPLKKYHLGEHRKKVLAVIETYKEDNPDRRKKIEEFLMNVDIPKYENYDQIRCED